MDFFLEHPSQPDDNDDIEKDDQGSFDVKFPQLWIIHGHLDLVCEFRFPLHLSGYNNTSLRENEGIDQGQVPVLTQTVTVSYLIFG